MDETRRSFLWNASQLLPPNQHITRLLKSYYLTNIKQAAENDLSRSNKSVFGDRTICKKCSARWCDGNFSVRHKPSAVSSPRAKKLVEALNKGKKLTRNQKVRAKWYRKRLQSAVITTCNLCRYKMPLYLEKPDKELVKPEIEVEEVKPKTKSKKKKKDKTAGLKVTSKQAPPQPPKKDKKLLPPSKNIKKAKNPSKQANAPSKTQQKNTLLQLATMLKANSRSSGSSNDRLKNLLK